MWCHKIYNFFLITKKYIMRQITKYYLKTLILVTFICAYFTTFRFSLNSDEDENKFKSNPPRFMGDLNNVFNLTVAGNSLGKSNEKFRMLVAVISSAFNFEARQAIRQAWNDSSSEIKDSKDYMRWNTTIGMCNYELTHFSPENSFYSLVFSEKKSENVQEVEIPQNHPLFTTTLLQTVLT